jgi:hypothetical protein
LFLGFLHVVKTVPLNVFDELNFPPTDRKVPLPAEQDKLQLIEKVYKPLLKMVKVWNDDPTKGDSAEWARINLEEPFWVKKVPSYIKEDLDEAEALFRELPKLRALTERLISDAESRFLGENLLERAGFARGEGIGSVLFRALVDGVMRAQIYPNWLWESRKTLSEYLMVIADSLYLVDPKWELETVVYGKKSGTGRTALTGQGTRDGINKILEYLDAQEPSRKLRENLSVIEKMGGKIGTMIDEELE